MRETPVTPQTETAPMDGVTETQHLRTTDNAELGSASTKAIACVTALSLAAAGLAYAWEHSPFHHMPRLISATPNVKKAKAVIKEVALVPEAFDCRTVTTYNASGSEIVASKDGFYRAARMTTGAAVQMTCLDDVSTRIVDGEVDQKTHARSENVFIDVSKIRVSTWLVDSATQVQAVDPSQFGERTSSLAKDALTTASEVGDYLVDGACKLITIGNCDNGVSNPADAAVNQSRKDDAAVEQALRVDVIKATQEQCAPLEWAGEKQAIIESYQKQFEAQGVPVSDLHIHWVDPTGAEVGNSFLPDYSKQLYGSASKIVDNVDVKLVQQKIDVTCTPNNPINHVPSAQAPSGNGN